MILTSASRIWSDCLRISYFSVLLGTVCINGCRFLVHSGAPLGCGRSGSYYLHNIQNVLLHADVTSISLLAYPKKPCWTTHTLKQTLLLAFMFHLTLSSISQRMGAIVPRTFAIMFWFAWRVLFYSLLEQNCKFFRSSRAVASVRLITNREKKKEQTWVQWT